MPHLREANAAKAQETLYSSCRESVVNESNQLLRPLMERQWTNAMIVLVERVAVTERWAFVTVGIAPRLFCYDCESCVTVVHIPLAPLMGIVKDQWKDVSNVKIGRNNIRSCWQCRESICLDCVRHDSNVRGYFLACFFCDNCWNDMDSVRSNA
jgi:hypothetical protein